MFSARFWCCKVQKLMKNVINWSLGKLFFCIRYVLQVVSFFAVSIPTEGYFKILDTKNTFFTDKICCCHIRPFDHQNVYLDLTDRLWRWRRFMFSFLISVLGLQKNTFYITLYLLLLLMTCIQSIWNLFHF